MQHLFNRILIHFIGWNARFAYCTETDLYFAIFYLIYSWEHLVSEGAASSHASNYWINCRFECTYFAARLSSNIMRSLFLKVFPTHTLSLPVQTCSFSGSPFQLAPFSSLSTPLVISRFSYNVRSHLSLLSPLSFVLPFLSVHQPTFSLSSFSFSPPNSFWFNWPQPLRVCVFLFYALTADSPLALLWAVKSHLECSLPVSEGFAEWSTLLGGWYALHLEGKHVNRPHRCAAGESCYCRMCSLCFFWEPCVVFLRNKSLKISCHNNNR